MESVTTVPYGVPMRSMVRAVPTVLLCVCGACGNVASQSALDAPQPDGSTGPRCDPNQPFLNPTLVPNVNSSSDESFPRLSSDELELFFASTRPGGLGSGDLYLARRASRDAEF